MLIQCETPQKGFGNVLATILLIYLRIIFKIYKISISILFFFKMTPLKPQSDE